MTTEALESTVDFSEEKISLKEKVSFALGDFSSNLFWMPFIIWGVYFYTNVCMIDPWLVGVIMFVARILDTVIDPIIGLIIDRTKYVKGVGQYRPYLRRFAIPFGVVGAACFYTPPGGGTAAVIYALGSYFLFGVTYSLINVPYSGTSSILSKSETERAVLSQYRMIGAQLSGFILSLAVPVMVGFFAGATAESKGDERSGYFYTFIIVGIAATIGWFISYSNIKERVRPKPKVSGRVLKDLSLVLFCAPIVLLFFVTMLVNTAYTIRFANIMFFFSYFAEAKAVENLGGAGLVTGMFFSCGTIFAILGNLLFVKLTKKWDKKDAFIFLMLLGGAVSILFQYIPRENIVAFFLAQAAFSFFTGPTGGFLWSMGTDVAAFIQKDKKQDVQGLVMAITSFTQKSGWVIGGLVAPFILSFVGYNAELKEQSSGVMNAMQYMMSYVPAVPCIFSAFVMILYPLSRKRMKQLGL